jgi:PadR family transcriptional regulator PadR
MPWGLTRFHHSGQSHFVTFCCYHRGRLFTTDASRRIFESALERVRRSFRLRVYGYVVMLEHVHLLISEPQRDTSSDGTAPLKPEHGLNGPPMIGEAESGTLADALKSLKQGVSRRLIGDADHFWQKRYYDFNIRNYPQFVEKLRYIHRNPVKAGLCESAEDCLSLTSDSRVSTIGAIEGRMSSMGKQGQQRGLLQGTLDMLILRTLLYGAAHGHEIGKHIQRTTNEFLQMQHGSLYPALHRLERRGWVVSKWETAPDRNREFKYYRLTDKGRKQLRVEESQWKQMSEAVARVMWPTAEEN